HSFLKEFELQHQGVNPRIVYRIPHGTHLNPYLGISRENLLAELSLSKERIKGYIMTMPGFLRKDKGLDVLIDSLEHVDREKFTLIIAGELRDRKLLDIIEYASSKMNIIYLARYLTSEEMLKLIALSDIIVLPYKDKRGSYSISGILHLSMGSFRPIIGTKVPRLIELYQYAPRLTIPPKAPKELSRKILWLIENYDFGVAYMAYLYGYSARTQWLRMARRHVSLYNNILKSEAST
ncbi:MAG: group 1 glycosyl transferase, partial [Thermoprotei archaeon]